MEHRTMSANTRDQSNRTDGPEVRRWVEQRWVLDNVIWANGVDWDQPRSRYFNAACGIEANADFGIIRDKVKKFADIGPAFEATARRREAKAAEAAAAGHKVTARDNFFMAAIHWGASMWPYDSVNPELLELNKRKRECYSQYARLADHRIEEVWIPFQGKSLAAWLHLPPGYSGGKLPVVISLPGVDTFKEIFVSLNGDRWMTRGVAVLAVDGPGQAESRLLGSTVSVENFVTAGKAIVDWLMQRPEIDPDRIGLFGNSFGSFTATLIAANEPRIRACAVSSTCLEPGFHTMLETASPTYKRRMMYMTGYSNESEFDAFTKSLTWEGHAERISMPYLCLAGEAEELSPLSYAERMIKKLSCPKLFVIYQDSRHAVGYVPAANLGPYPPTLIADWMVDRFARAPFKSERWYIQANGAIVQTPL
jgi:alpha-beta hydrolase superfamily lysophospholipase